MNNWIDLTNFAIAVGGLVVAVLGLSLVIISPYISVFQKKYFTVFFSFLFLYIASDLISQISLDFLGEKYSLRKNIIMIIYQIIK